MTETRHRRYRQLRRADAKVELDRKTWADLDKVSYDVLVRGGGEYLLPTPIYFGRAFENPPFFNYSATLQNAEDPNPDVRNIGYLHRELGKKGVSHKLLQAADPLNPTASLWLPLDSYQAEGFLADPSFEHHGIWGDPDIPTWEEAGTHATKGWDNYQKIAEEDIDGIRAGSDYWWEETLLSNHWVQGVSTHRKWEVVEDNPMPVGTDRYQGHFTARYTFDGDTTSRWIIPIMAHGFANPYLGWGPGDVAGPHNWAIHEYDVFTHHIPLNEGVNNGLAGVHQTPNGKLIPAWNPPFWPLKYLTNCYSDGPLTAEIRLTIFDNEEFWPEDLRYLLRIVDQTTTEYELTPNEWNSFTTTYNPNELASRIYPNTIPLIPELVAFYSAMQWAIRFKNGVSGQKVWIDEMAAWANYQTNPVTPFITVGVSEWVQDEQGMYIGAYLWFKTVTGRGESV